MHEPKIEHCMRESYKLSMDQCERAQISRQNSAELQVMETTENMMGKKINLKHFQERFCIFDEENMVLRILKDERTRKSHRVISLYIVTDVQVMPASSDFAKIQLIISPPGHNVSKRFIILASNSQILLEWANKIMKLGLQRENVNESSQPSPNQCNIGKQVLNSVSESFDKADMLEVSIDGESKKQHLYVVINQNLVIIFKDINNFAACLPMDYVDMKFAGVKKQIVGKAGSPCSVELTGSNDPESKNIILFHFKRSIELESWFAALVQSIEVALSDSTSVFDQITSNKSNHFCADCNAPKPNWASLNYLVVICQQCSGIHRNFEISRVRSFLTNVNDWTQDSINLFTKIGNDKANAFWEGLLPPKNDEKPEPNWTTEKRKRFIHNKYILRRFVNQSSPVTTLQSVVKTDDVATTMKLLFSSKEPINILDADLINIAQKAGQSMQMEFLRHNLNLNLPSTQSPFVEERPFRSGFLYVKVKEGKEFPHQWVKLANGDLYLGNAIESSIDCNNGIHVIMVNDKEITLITKKYTIHLKAPEITDDISDWQCDLIKSYLPSASHDRVLNIDIAILGKVDMKRSLVASWKQSWAILTNDRRLFLVNEAVDDSTPSKTIEEFDLRKVNSPVRDVAEENGAFSFSVVDNSLDKEIASNGEQPTALYIRSSTSDISQLWRTRLNEASTKSGVNLEDQVLTRDDIPLIVSECLNFVSGNSSGVDGLYRISGAKGQVESLLSKYRKSPQSVHLSIDEYAVHTVTGALKLFLRELEDPPLTKKLQKDWLDTHMYHNMSKRLDRYKTFVKQLPQVNFNTLRAIFIHLDSIVKMGEEQNMVTQQVGIDGFATVFGPCLVGDYSANLNVELATSCHIAGVAYDLIKNYRDLFDVGEEAVRKESTLRRAIVRIESSFSIQKDLPSMQDDRIKVDVSLEIDQATDDCVQFDISAETKSSDILEYLVDKNHINSADRLSLYEVISQEIERAIFPEESIYNIVMNWPYLKHDTRVDVAPHLCVKFNYIFEERINLTDEPRASMDVKVDYFDAASKFWRFSKRLLVVQDNTLQIKKSLQSSPNKVINVSNVSIYYGIEKRHKAPRNWGMTLISYPKMPPSRTSWAMKVESEDVICFLSEKDLNEVFLALNYAKFPKTVVFQSFMSGAKVVRAVGAIEKQDRFK